MVSRICVNVMKHARIMLGSFKYETVYKKLLAVRLLYRSKTFCIG